MQHLLKVFTCSTVFALFLASCTSQDEPQNAVQTNPSVKVGSLSDYVPYTRVGHDEKVMIFRDMETYDSVYNRVKALSENEKSALFQEMGFVGAYTILNNAEVEIEKIFDDAETGVLDSIQMGKKISEYKLKYADMLEFNQKDEYDATPYLVFEDERAELLGTHEGYVVVDNKVVKPFGVSTRAVDTGEFHTYEKSEVKLKGKSNYNSYFHLGKMGEYLAIKMVTYKQKFLHKVFDKTCRYTCHIKIKGQGGGLIDTDFNGVGVFFRTDMPLRSMSPYMDLELTNFTCSRYPEKSVSKTINNILVN